MDLLLLLLLLLLRSVGRGLAGWWGFWRAVRWLVVGAGVEMWFAGGEGREREKWGERGEREREHMGRERVGAYGRRGMG